MSKKSSNVSPGLSPMSGRALYDYDIQNLEGDILTIIESFGLSDSQERAGKNLIRNALYQLYRLPQVDGTFLNEAIKSTQDAGIGWATVPSPTSN